MTNGVFTSPREDLPPNRSEAEQPPEVFDRAPPARVLGRVKGSRPGPTLICIAGLHGNEPAGVDGLTTVFRHLEGLGDLIRGEAVALTGNRGALAVGRRFLARDLNRLWLDDLVAQVEAKGPSSPEEVELAELGKEVAAVLARARGPAFLLDIHTTSGPGPCFALVEDTLRNRRFALAFPAPLVLGIEEELEGTLSHYLSRQGVITTGFEAGQHDDPAAPERAAAAAWIALGASGVLPTNRPEVEAAWAGLETENRELPKVVEVRHRHAFRTADGFEMDPGYISFQPVSPRQPIASDRNGPVSPPEEGLLLMPLYQAQGNEGYFLVRRVRPFWLKLSAGIRILHLERLLPLLPGVDPHPHRSDAFVVDREIARWFALELFHLLGFRRKGPLGRHLTLVRRHDGHHHQPTV